MSNEQPLNTMNEKLFIKDDADLADYRQFSTLPLRLRASALNYFQGRR